MTKDGIPPEMVPLLRAILTVASRTWPPEISADEARAAHTGPEPPSPNAWGAAFAILSSLRAIEFVRRTRSTRPEARGRFIHVWRVRDFHALRRLAGVQEGMEEVQTG